MAIVLRAIPDVINMYQEWVRTNPQLTSEIESSVKWISYFLAGKVSDSTVISELVYSISNLWVLLNDKIVLNAQNRIHTFNDSRITIKTWLTVLEYSEVFIEVSARQVFGKNVKWIVILMIQTFKCALRLLLVIKYRENILQCPPIAPLERKKYSKENSNNDIQSFHGTSQGEAFELKSGRTIRTVNSATSSIRSWRPPSSQSLQKIREEDYEHNLTENQRVGEVLYIVKPVVHLGSLLYCGEKAWVPWFLSLVMDFSSLTLLKGSDGNKDNKKIIWSKQQCYVLEHRKMILLLYLLRSPFYDHYTKERLNKLLLTLSQSIPLAGVVLRPLAQYLPYWQETYLYLWSS